MRKGQEEIIGFVLIVVIVAIIFLVFLGISIRNSEQESFESTDVYQFLETAMEFTTNCSLSSPPDYSRLGELFEECYSGNRCHDGKSSCERAETDMTAILEGSWNVQEGSSVKGYDFTSTYNLNGTGNKEILSIKKGNCNDTIKGASYLIPAFPGRIENVLVLC